MTPYRKLKNILNSHTADNFGLRNLMYHILLSLGYDANIEFPDVEYNLPNKIVKSSNIDIQIEGTQYSLDLDNSNGMVIINNETRENEIVYPNNSINKGNIKIDDIER